MAKREIDIILKARNEASKDIKKVKADLDSIGGTKLSGMVASWKNMSAYAETMKTVLVPIAAIGAIMREDWDAVDQSMSRLPMGLGEVYQLLKMAGGELFGWTKELERLNKLLAQTKRELGDVNRTVAMARDWQRQIAFIRETAGKGGLELDEIRIRDAQRRRLLQGESLTGSDARTWAAESAALMEAQLAEARRKSAAKAAEGRKSEAEKIAAETEKQERTLRQRIEDLRVKAIDDGHERELAAIRLRYRREIEIARKAGRDLTLIERARAMELAGVRQAAARSAAAGTVAGTESRFLTGSLQRPLLDETRKHTEFLKLLGHLPEVVRKLAELVRGQAGTARVAIGAS